MSFGALNINVALQINNKILFEEPFGDTLRTHLGLLLRDLKVILKSYKLILLFDKYFHKSLLVYLPYLTEDFEK